MQVTPGYGWSYPESGDHTRTWEYWEAQVKAIENTIRNGYRMFGFIEFGDNNYANNAFTAFNKKEGADVYRATVGMSTGGLLNLGLSKNGVEVNRFRLAVDGSIRIENSGQPARYLPFALFAGTITATLTNQSATTALVTFPASRFTAIPRVLLTTQDSAWNAASASGATTGGVNVAIRHVNDTLFTGSVNVDYLAIQMLPTAGPGLAATAAGDRQEIVVCHTAQCDNAESEITVDVPDDQTPVICGVCGQTIEDRNLA